MKTNEPNKTEAVMAYFCKYYPHKDELSKARLNKMIYLADWRAAITLQRTISSTDWIFNHYGPYVIDIEKKAEDSHLFFLLSTNNIYGSPKKVIGFNSSTTQEMIQKEIEKLNTDDIVVLDHVIEQTEKLSWNPFINMVYSTYPILISERYDKLDLVELASKYNNL